MMLQQADDCDLWLRHTICYGLLIIHAWRDVLYIRILTMPKHALDDVGSRCSSSCDHRQVICRIALIFKCN